MKTDLPMPGARPAVTTEAVAATVVADPAGPGLVGRLRAGVLAAGRERMSAATLALASVVALVWASSPWSAGYTAFWSTPVVLEVGSAGLHLSAHELVNDALMAVFFFGVGLEVRRELTIGELTDRARAVVPAAAAVAGLVLPALLFALVAGEHAGAWGVVISTDTAFLLGALALVGPRHPARLRVFLLTLAVVDDIGALIAIALFYSDAVRLAPLLVTAGLLALVAAVRFLPAGRGPAYLVLAVLVWLALHAAGVHPTLAGVAVALLVPVFEPRRREVERVEGLARAFRQSPSPRFAAATTRSLRESLSPNERMQDAIGPFMAYVVLPLFALANAGVRLDGAMLAAAARSPLTWAVVIGLVVGKLVSITGATALVQRLGWGRLAPGLTLGRVAGGAALSGIGFTISLLMVDIALPDEQAAAQARVGVLAASVVAFGLGTIAFRLLERYRPVTPVGHRLLREVDPTRDHVRGRLDAPHVLVEYGDFECPFCSRATGSVDEVRAALGDDVLWVFRHLPLTRVHPHAVLAARAAEAAHAQGRFFDYAPLLFARHDRLEREDLLAYAADLRLDVERFETDLDSPDVARRVQDDEDDADLMDLHTTPTFFVDGVRHDGPWDAASLVAALRD